MQVILNQDVKGQGKKGQLVKVSDGYARNYLLPRGLAKEATKANINELKGKAESLEYKIQTEKNEAAAIADKMKEIEVVITAKAGSNGKLFGSVTSKDVSEELIKQHHIKNLGVTEVEVKLYTGITGRLKVVVKEA